MSDPHNKIEAFAVDVFPEIFAKLRMLLPTGFTLTVEISDGNETVHMQVVAASTIVTISEEDAA